MVVALLSSLVALPAPAQAVSAGPVTATGRGRVTINPNQEPAGEPLPWYSNRDCGYSTRLDASIQRWVLAMCDTQAWNPNNQLRGGGTATAGVLDLVPATSAISSHDPIGSFNPPGLTQLIDPPSTETNCAGGRVAAWPHGVASIPDQYPATYLLAVFFQAYCITGTPPNENYERRSTGVGFVVYDPANASAPLHVDSTNPALYKYPLFPGTNTWSSPAYPDDGYGFGAVVEGDYLFIHQCGQTPGAQQFKCFERRVHLNRTNALLDIVGIGTAANYQDLRSNGTWGTDGNPRNIIDPTGSHATDPLYQVNSGVSITRINALGTYVMSYMTPDFRIVFRTVSTLVDGAGTPGQWSAPVEISAPCSGPGPNWAFPCYQPVVQEAMYSGATGTIGFTYFDTGLTSMPSTTARGYGALRGASIPKSALGL